VTGPFSVCAFGVTAVEVAAENTEGEANPALGLVASLGSSRGIAGAPSWGGWNVAGLGGINKGGLAKGAIALGRFCGGSATAMQGAEPANTAVMAITAVFV
jgi:hypothetical protein